MEQLNSVKDCNIESKFKEIKYLINIFLEELKINKGIKLNKLILVYMIRQYLIHHLYGVRHQVKNIIL